MKIIHIDTARTWRGGQNQVYLLLKYLGEDCPEIKTVLFTSEKSPLAQKVKTLPGKTEIVFFSNAWTLITGLVRYAREKETLVHCHSAQAHSRAWLSKALFRWKAPLIVHRRVDFVPRKTFWNRRKYCSALVNGYIAISGTIQDILTGWGISAERIHRIHSGVDFEYLDKAEPADLRKITGTMPNVPVFLNTGALTDHKGQIYLLEAVRILKELGEKLLLLICGEGELRPQFEEFISRNALQDMAVLAGFQPNVASVLKSADFFVMSSHLEGLGTSVIDALYLKKPAVVSGAGGIPEIVKNGQLAPCVPPRDAEALARAMQKLLRTDKKELLDRAQKAHEDVKERFHYKKMGNQIVQIYNRYLKKEVLG